MAGALEGAHRCGNLGMSWSTYKKLVCGKAAEASSEESVVASEEESASTPHVDPEAARPQNWKCSEGWHNEWQSQDWQHDNWWHTDWQEGYGGSSSSSAPPLPPPPPPARVVDSVKDPILAPRVKAKTRSPLVRAAVHPRILPVPPIESPLLPCGTACLPPRPFPQPPPGPPPQLVEPMPPLPQEKTQEELWQEAEQLRLQEVAASNAWMLQQGLSESTESGIANELHEAFGHMDTALTDAFSAQNLRRIEAEIDNVLSPLSPAQASPFAKLITFVLIVSVAALVKITHCTRLQMAAHQIQSANACWKFWKRGP